MAAMIAVYADWVGLAEPLRLGWLHARRGAGREVFEFEFDAAVLAHSAAESLHLDPRLGLFEERQHLPQGHETFGVFADASPDRWGSGAGVTVRRTRKAEDAGCRDVHGAAAPFKRSGPDSVRGSSWPSCSRWRNQKWNAPARRATL
jgi:serine/threonine-protein kinase HipA